MNRWRYLQHFERCLLLAGQKLKVKKMFCTSNQVCNVEEPSSVCTTQIKRCEVVRSSVHESAGSFPWQQVKRLIEMVWKKVQLLKLKHRSAKRCFPKSYFAPETPFAYITMTFFNQSPMSIWFPFAYFSKLSLAYPTSQSGTQTQPRWR